MRLFAAVIANLLFVGCFNYDADLDACISDFRCKNVYTDSIGDYYDDADGCRHYKGAVNWSGSCQYTSGANENIACLTDATPAQLHLTVIWKQSGTATTATAPVDSAPISVSGPYLSSIDFDSNNYAAKTGTITLYNDPRPPSTTMGAVLISIKFERTTVTPSCLIFEGIGLSMNVSAP